MSETAGSDPRTSEPQPILPYLTFPLYLTSPPSACRANAGFRVLSLELRRGDRIVGNVTFFWRGRAPPYQNNTGWGLTSRIVPAPSAQLGESPHPVAPSNPPSLQFFTSPCHSGITNEGIPVSHYRIVERQAHASSHALMSCRISLFVCETYCESEAAYRVGLRLWKNKTQRSVLYRGQANSPRRVLRPEGPDLRTQSVGIRGATKGST